MKSLQTAAKKLEKIGYRNVYDFEGCMKEWKDAGYEVETID